MRFSTLLFFTLLYAFILNAQVQRKILHEGFTGSNCSPCAPAADSLSELLHNNPNKYTVIKYQAGSDPYMTDETVSRVVSYQGGGSYSIPYLCVDGDCFKPNDKNGDGTYGDYYDQTDFDQFYIAPSYLEINISDFAITEQTVSADISVLVKDTLSGIYKLHIAIIEKTTYNNLGSNGQIEFHYVLKKMVPNQNGTTYVNINYGDTIKQTLSYTFNGTYNDSTSLHSKVDHNIEHTVEDFNDLEVVVFFQKLGSNEVLQSEWTIEEISDIEEIKRSLFDLVVFPNPTNGNITIDYFLKDDASVFISLYNSLGKTVYDKLLNNQIAGSYTNTIKRLELANGLYFLELNANGNKERKSILVNN